MRIPSRIEKLFVRTVDAWYEKWPQPEPRPEQLHSCRIVSHRGEHDNITVLENSLQGFDAALRGGVWGIEFDIRWTADLEPVVFHDKDLKRIFGSPLEIRRVTRRELRKGFPAIPFLEEVAARYGKRMHLMAEIKAEAYPEPKKQSLRLFRIFEGLAPGADYHFLSLVPAMFRHLDFVPASACIAVAQVNLREMSRAAIANRYRGVAGHYLFVAKRLIRLHHKNRQQVGTGYVRSRNCLYREINRGVDWIFSNHAVALQKMRDDSIREGVSATGPPSL